MLVILQKKVLNAIVQLGKMWNFAMDQLGRLLVLHPLPIIALKMLAMALLCVLMPEEVRDFALQDKLNKLLLVNLANASTAVAAVTIVILLCPAPPAEAGFASGMLLVTPIYAYSKAFS
tara:strand:- start:1188 stop:1544 length:357 start_codon:yes stop_codon:yes gene_type:complete